MSLLAHVITKCLNPIVCGYITFYDKNFYNLVYIEASLFLYDFCNDPNLAYIATIVSDISLASTCLRLVLPRSPLRCPQYRLAKLLLTDHSKRPDFPKTISESDYTYSLMWLNVMADKSIDQIFNIPEVLSWYDQSFRASRMNNLTYKIMT